MCESILSPNLFNVFVDVIIDALIKSGYGWFVLQIYSGYIVITANDIMSRFASVAAQEIR